ncbi:AEC family transporter [Halothermothrix orenii]|uniref:Auxin Efflux Carrier n=1 Tax=Halothermothrix orenii (strain H 168 / OCM 544 / DSM 9562) TaxID=373903 RepID=B8D0P0_HALOH|nr:AEC family transporter [Halothermothrix orenii]ACL70976.1 Auxin Efflux Carrier [Halothermothrix orenii H 168]
MELNFIAILSKFIPVVVLMGIGYYLRVKTYISQNTVNDIKKLVVNIALPALLFNSFLNVNFQVNYLYIIIMVFLGNLILLFTGYKFKGFIGVDDEYVPLLFSGFEVGMLGIPLFTAVFGIENVKYIGIIDIGHEIYIWFVLLGILLTLKKGKQSYKQLARSFITSPIIIAILMGMVFNTAGIPGLLKNIYLYNGIIDSISLLSNITVPLILLIIGFELDFKANSVRLPLKISALRLIFAVLVAGLIGFTFVDFLKLNRMYVLALMVMFILPPPFIIPLFIKEDKDKDKSYIYNTLSLHSLISIAAFMAVSLLASIMFL